MIKIISIKDRDDGTADVKFEYDKEFSDIVKKIYKRKRVSKKLIQKAVIDGLKNYIEQEKKK